MVYAIENPEQGFLEVEDMDHTRVMDVMAPFLGTLKGAYTEWNPLVDRGKYFEEDIIVDSTDPWQFCNVRYH